jgi:hypothetical protein
MNYHKYNKYNTKCLKLKNTEYQEGGSKNKKSKKSKKSDKFEEILDFIQNSKKEKIQKKLYELLSNKDYCPILLGEGQFGKAYVPQINKTFTFRIGKNKKDIELPIVIKESKNINNPDAYFGIDIIDDVLYVSSYDNMTSETLILMYIRKLWYHTVHLPLIFAYGTCSESKIVNRVVTLKHGLDEFIEIDLAGKFYNEVQLWHKQREKTKEIFKSSIATLNELFTYIHYKKNKDGTVKLPNGQICDVVELFDYICISYLATHELLTQNNIFPSDMHAGNLFIHWLNDNSYYDNNNIKNIKEITYKIGKKYYKIKTFGFVIILGDVGTFIVQPKKDVIIVGHVADIKNNYKLIEKRLMPEYTNIIFISWNISYLTPKEYKNTIAYNILNSEPYCDYPKNDWHLFGKDTSFINKLKLTVELLSFYDEKYGSTTYKKTKDNILIEAKKY